MPTYPHIETYHKELEDIIKFGGCANYINIRNTIDIGFIPNIPTDRIHKIGNASLQGATTMLTNSTKRVTIEHLATQIIHIEVETNPNFFDHFVQGCQFKI